MAVACAPGDGARYDSALDSSAAIVIVRVESVSLLPAARDPLFVPYAEATTRVVTPLKGSVAKKLVIEFNAHSCGGVRLDIGRYYLVVLSDLSDHLVLKSDDERIFTLEGEFSESAPVSSPLIDSMEHFVETGERPGAELVWEYYGRTRWPLEHHRSTE